jgi:hypothetical protein
MRATMTCQRRLVGTPKNPQLLVSKMLGFGEAGVGAGGVAGPGLAGGAAPGAGWLWGGRFVDSRTKVTEEGCGVEDVSGTVDGTGGAMVAAVADGIVGGAATALVEGASGAATDAGATLARLISKIPTPPSASSTTTAAARTQTPRAAGLVAGACSGGFSVPPHAPPV